MDEATADETTEGLERLIAPVVEGRDLHLYDIERAGSVLRILVDGPDGVDLDLLARLSGDLSAVLDAADPVPGRYTLEVSSPGLERPLRRPAHFRAAIGARVRLKTRPGVAGERRAEGELVTVDDESITLDVAGVLRRLAYEDIERARTVFVWGPAERPGASRRSGSTNRGKTGKATTA